MRHPRVKRRFGNVTQHIHALNPTHLSTTKPYGADRVSTTSSAPVRSTTPKSSNAYDSEHHHPPEDLKRLTTSTKKRPALSRFLSASVQHLFLLESAKVDLKFDAVSWARESSYIYLGFQVIP